MNAIKKDSKVTLLAHAQRDPQETGDDSASLSGFGSPGCRAPGGSCQAPPEAD